MSFQCTLHFVKNLKLKQMKKGRTDWDAADAFVIMLSFGLIIVIILERVLKVI